MGCAVMVVDDHPVIHTVLREVARAAYAGAVVYSEGELPAALLRAQAMRRLDLVLLELEMPGCSRIGALERFRETCPAVRVVIVSACAEGSTIRAALAAGAAGYIPKTTQPKTMVAALRLVASAGIYVPAEALGGLPGEADRDARPWSLTERQAEILRLLVRGMPNREIARQLGITENTVKQHTHAVYQALRVGNRTAAAFAAARLGAAPD